MFTAFFALALGEELFRILIVWLYNNTGGSVFAVALFHATLNLSFMLFPVNGSHFDMRLAGLVMTVVAVVVGQRQRSRHIRPAFAPLTQHCLKRFASYACQAHSTSTSQTLPIGHR